MEMTIRFSRSEDYPEMMAIENRIWNEKNTPQVTVHKSMAGFSVGQPYRLHFGGYRTGKRDRFGSVAFR